MRDWRGLPISHATQATLEAIDVFATGWLGYHPSMLSILPAAERDLACPMAQAMAATLQMLGETRAAPDAARPLVERAEAALAGATDRERAMVAATRAWVDDDVPRALTILDGIVADHPRDVLAGKLAQYHRFNRGDAAGLRHTGLAVQAANDDVAHAHSMAAFGHEQCGEMRAAERAAYAALERDADEPWAHHAIAHVLLTEGRNDEARAFLTRAAPSWDGRLSFIRTHNHWHLTLVRIEQGEGSAVLDAFDRHVWNDEPSLPQDQVGAVSLLARLELVGVDVGDRWTQLAPWLLARVDDHALPFLSMLYLYGLARAGETAAAHAMFAAIRAVDSGWSAWDEVCVPASEGLLAHAIGDMAGAAWALDPVMARLERIGGSHAQRDLFEQIYTDALARSGRVAEAAARLRARLLGNPDSVPSRLALARLTMA